jgi:hypothetical protein
VVACAGLSFAAGMTIPGETVYESFLVSVNVVGGLSEETGFGAVTGRVVGGSGAAEKAKAVGGAVLGLRVWLSVWKGVVVGVTTPLRSRKVFHDGGCEAVHEIVGLCVLPYFGLEDSRINARAMGVLAYSDVVC